MCMIIMALGMILAFGGKSNWNTLWIAQQSKMCMIVEFLLFFPLKYIKILSAFIRILGKASNW